MALETFRCMTKDEREKFWLKLYTQYKTYPGSLSEFLKEHDVAPTSFYRWSKKFNDQRISNIPENPDEIDDNQAFSPISSIDKAIQQAADEIDDSHLEDDNKCDDLDNKISQLESHDNAIMASMELVLPDGYKIRLTNHADVSLAIRLIQGMSRHD